MKKYAFLVAVLAASLVSACSDSSGDVIQSHGGNTNETSDNPDTCTDQCSEEGSTCESEGVILKCTDSNGDGCLELVRKECAKGKICKNGKCSIVEDDSEEPVESEDHECNDNGDCSENQTCTNGKCVSKLDGCLDECSGASVCEGTDGYKECKDTNDDGCKEWTAVTKCDAGEVCSDGACKKAELLYKGVYEF